jgi:hypothetical protein
MLGRPAGSWSADWDDQASFRAVEPQSSDINIHIIARGPDACVSRPAQFATT